MSLYRQRRNWGCRVRETRELGIHAIALENRMLRISVLPGKGTDLVEFNYKPLDLDFVWLAPGGIRNPAVMHSTSPDPLATFLDSYPGGWQEVFPNAGAPALHAGARFGQHGEVFALPWDVEVTEDAELAVAVRCTVRGQKTPCTIKKTLRLTGDAPVLEIRESVTNESPVTIEAMWGHHITFGKPFLNPGHRIVLPEQIVARPHQGAVGPGGRRVASNAEFTWPHATGADGRPLDLSTIPEPGTASDLYYLSGFPDSTAWYELVDPEDGVGMRVEWDATTMPYLWYWQEFGATTGYPWYGRAYTVGLEPSSSYPTNGLPDAVANGSALVLGPGETRHFWLRASVLDLQGADVDRPGRLPG